MFTLDQVVPWGRSFDEYCRMFSLTASDLGLHILGCADGPASFNVEATCQGTRVVSCDPLYRFAGADIQDRIAATYDCSHFLFLYSGHVDEAFHLAAIREMSRVASEVRIFPLVTLSGEPSPFVDVCRRRLHEAGCEVSIEPVEYECQRGGNRMMRVHAKR